MGGTSLRLLGVHGKNAPTKKSKTVQPADFNIAGLIGQFERKYDQVFPINNPVEQAKIFGDNINSNWYGNDVAKNFWDNLLGQPGTLFIKSHVGYTGSVIDAVVASDILTDQNGLPSIITLMTEMMSHYTAHEADAKLGSGWAYHNAQETVSHSLASIIPPMDLSQIITKLNDIKSAYNGHDADATAHTTGSTHQETTADASDLASAIALVNSLETTMDAHAADSGIHRAGVDAVNFPLASAAATSTPVTTLKFQAGYKSILEYGISGNRTGYQVINGIRYATTVAFGMTVSDTSIKLASVSGIKVGDIVVINGTGATPGIINVKVTNINEGTSTISWVGASAITATIGDTVEVPGFKIKTFRISISGLVSEVETALGSSWCTMESSVIPYYVQNIHSQNGYLVISDQTSTSTGIEAFPDEVDTTVYLSSGADGTSPTTPAHWSRDLTAFDPSPIRMLANPETSSVAIQKAGETYCVSRDDTPFWIATLSEDQTMSQLQTIGSGYQRSNFVAQVNVADWCGITDPFNSAPNAPDRYIPNVGAVMGAWIQSISTLGIHYIPATDQIILTGVNSIKNDNLGVLSDADRTNLAEYGVNIIQFVSGSGYRIRNFFTPSTSQDVQFANGPMMRNFIKVSATNSLQSSENMPNSFNRIVEDKNAINQFMYQLWYRGSTGNVPTGETFGIQQNTDGTFTKPTDHFEVQADAINNPLTAINSGQRNIACYFTYPTPAGSIEIDVGILLRS